MKADNIKIGKIISFIFAILGLVIAIIFFSKVEKYSNSMYYYISKSYKSYVTFFKIGGIISIIISIQGWFFAFWYLYLQKKGKVCPRCQNVLVPSAAECPKCHEDVTHALGVAEYLSKHPDQNQSVGVNAKNDESSNTKRYCSACGSELKNGAKFCQNCGSKNE